METQTAEHRVTDQDVEALRRSLYEGMLTHEQACAALGISRSTLSRMVAAGRFSSVPIGSRSYVPCDEIAEHIAGLRREASQRRADAAAGARRSRRAGRVRAAKSSAA